MTSRWVNPVNNNILRDDDGGTVLPSGSLQFYAAGTTTPLEVYSDSALTTSLGTYIDADVNGQLPDFHLASGTEYKVRAYDAIGGESGSGAVKWTRDEVFGGDSSLETRLDALESTVGSLSQVASNTLGNGGMRVTTAAGAQDLSTSYQVGLVADVWGKVSANLTSGTLTQGEDTNYASGHYLHFSALTTSGAADVLAQFRMTSEQAAQYVDNPLAFKCKVYQDSGAAVDYSLTVYKCASKDDFSSLTSIQAGSAVSVSDVTDTAMSIAVTTMGDCSNGIVIEVKAELSGAVSSKNFRIAEAKAEASGAATAFDEEGYREQVAALSRKLLVDDAITASASMDYATVFSDNPEWRYFFISVEGAQTASSSTLSFRVSTDGSTFESSVGDYRFGATSVQSASSGGTAGMWADDDRNALQFTAYTVTTTMLTDCDARITNPGSSTVTPIRFSCCQVEPAGEIYTTEGSGFYDTAGAITGINLYATSGGLAASGRIKIWGSNTPF